MGEDFSTIISRLTTLNTSLQSLSDSVIDLIKELQEIPDEPTDPIDPPEPPQPPPQPPTTDKPDAEAWTVSVGNQGDKKKVNLPDHSNCKHYLRYRINNRNGGRLLSSASSTSMSGFDVMSFAGKLCIGTDRGDRTYSHCYKGKIHNPNSSSDHWLECGKTPTKGELVIEIKDKRIKVTHDGELIGDAVLRKEYKGKDWVYIGASGFTGDGKDRSQPGVYYEYKFWKL